MSKPVSGKPEPVIEPGSGFSVVAVKAGYYGGKVRVPDEGFEITVDSHFSKNWMKRKEA